MAKDKHANPNSEQSLQVESTGKRSMRIPPETLHLLRSATIPAEFWKIARELTPSTEILPSITPDDFPASADAEEPLMERAMLELPDEAKPEMSSKSWQKEPPAPQFVMPVEPVWQEIPWTTPEIPSEPPKEVRRGESTETFYLTDLKLDLSSVAHMTPGLVALTGVPLEWMVCGTFFLLEDGTPCPKCILVVLIDDKLWSRASFVITHDRVEQEGVIGAKERELIRKYYRGETGTTRMDLVIKTQQEFEELLNKWKITDPNTRRRILQHFASGDAVAGARDWALERSRKPGSCFVIWELNDTSAFNRLRSYEIKNGQRQEKKEYQKSKFSEMLPKLKNRKGRIDELIVFHHGEKVLESNVLKFLKDRLVDELRIPVCRLVYWACNAAVSIDIVRAQGPKLYPEPEAVSAGKAAIELMEGFLALAYERTPAEPPEDECPCDGPVEFIYPTEGKCGVNLPFDDPRAFTGDGKVRRISFGYRQGDGSIGRDPADPINPIVITDPSDRPYATEKGELLGVPVTERKL